MLYVVDLGQYAELARPDGPERLQAIGAEDTANLAKLLRQVLLGVSDTCVKGMKLAPISGTGKVATHPLGDHFEVQFDVRVKVVKRQTPKTERKIERRAKRCTQS